MSKSRRLDPAELAALSKHDRLAALRDSIATVGGKVGAATAMPAEPPTGRKRNPWDGADRSAPPSEQQADVGEADGPLVDGIVVPGGIGALLPGGGLAYGSVVGCRGSTGILTGLLAAATGSGAWAAIVGGRRQRIGLLAVTEMGGRLDRLAVIDASGGDPLETVSVLADGVPLIVCDTPAAVPPKRAQTLTAKIRNQQGILVITDRVRGIRPDLTLTARPTAIHGLGPGYGRLRELHLTLEVSGRNTRPRRGELRLTANGNGRTAWAPAAESAAAARWSRAG
ncbi:hypothetical protein BJY24_005718 [Nocardia transvalensis]|uniref:Uncharacterized protein n=1 Tax=Nocardia transvalensis TaxID=37333 RepID=A0A7W9PIM7_9NOCA|nr:hypothetical protein [Nocardia transvalensis]MBB5916806.1 hypothetical protein [Nocardia transvalensis]